MIPTTLLVDGSIMWILSPALLVWIIRIVLAARGKASRNPRRLKAGFLGIKFMIVSLNKSILIVADRMFPKLRNSVQNRGRQTRTFLAGTVVLAKRPNAITEP